MRSSFTSILLIGLAFAQEGPACAAGPPGLTCGAGYTVHCSEVNGGEECLCTTLLGAPDLTDVHLWRTSVSGAVTDIRIFASPLSTSTSKVDAPTLADVREAGRLALARRPSGASVDEVRLETNDGASVFKVVTCLGPAWSEASFDRGLHFLGESSWVLGND